MAAMVVGGSVFACVRLKYVWLSVYRFICNDLFAQLHSLWTRNYPFWFFFFLFFCFVITTQYLFSKDLSFSLVVQFNERGTVVFHLKFS